jgi:type II secretory pathway pseudopilin PulG
MKKEQGFSLVEALISTCISVVILAGALNALNDSLGANEKTAQITDLAQNLRSGMNLIVDDFMSAGWSIPIGGIPIPSGAGANPVKRPGPPGTYYTFSSETLEAVNPGPTLGPAWNGRPTDIVNILFGDNSEVTYPLNGHPLAAVSTNGDSVTVNDLTPLDQMSRPIRVGDLIYLNNGNGSTLQYVTGVAGQTISFAPGDPMSLNQPDTDGSITRLRNNGEDVFPPTTASRVWLITYFLDFVEDPNTPRLVRRINNNQGQAVALVLENLELSYDLVDGATNPAGVKAPTPPNGPNQIRKANILISGRSTSVMRNSGEYLRQSLTTQVSLRSLSYVDRYSTGGN